MPGEGADTLATHRVPLVGHSRTSNLVLLEGLLNLLEVGEKTNIGGDLMSGSSQGSEGTENVDVDLAGVGLSSDGVGLAEARELGDESIELLDLFSVGQLCWSAGKKARHQRTLSWSPSKRARKDPWVPVVPLTPRNPISSRARWMFLRSQRSSCEVRRTSTESQPTFLFPSPAL